MGLVVVCVCVRLCVRVCVCKRLRVLYVGGIVYISQNEEKTSWKSNCESLFKCNLTGVQLLVKWLTALIQICRSSFLSELSKLRASLAMLFVNSETHFFLHKCSFNG